MDQIETDLGRSVSSTNERAGDFAQLRGKDTHGVNSLKIVTVRIKGRDGLFLEV